MEGVRTEGSRADKGREDKSREEKSRAAGVRLIAHRGYTPAAPANSIPAFREAGKRGFWAIETDVRRTADGYLVCIHDESPEQTYIGSGNVAELTLRELYRMERREAETSVPCDPKELRIPLFSEYLAVCREYHAVPFIETKTGDVRQVLEEALACFPPGGIVMSSIDFAHLEQVRRLTDRVFIHHIFSDEDHMRKLAEMGTAGLSYNYPDLAEVPDGLIARTHEMGVCVCLRAGDSPEIVRRMYDLGLDYVPTNRVTPADMLARASAEGVVIGCED